MSVRTVPATAVICVLFACAVEAVAQGAEPIHYRVTFPAPSTHYVEVEASYPTEGRPHIELMMAVWTPGSYLVREYSRHVEDVRAESAGGTALAVEKTRKNRWRIQTGGAATVTVRYRVYSREMSVRTNWIERGFAFLNGAATFITLADRSARPHHVEIAPPDDWKSVVSPLDEDIVSQDRRFVAPDFDTLVDSPIVAGNPAVHRFEVDGKPHALVNLGEDDIWNGPVSARDVAAIVREHVRMWGSVPYPRYVFFNLITEGSGGLEHVTSTAIMTTRWRRTRSAYLSWLGTVSHEFFHAWNVKRLRPVALGPFDYEQEAYTPDLWIAEGFTSYYGNLALRRAGLSNDAEYMQTLSHQIEQLQTTPGRLVRSADLSSFDAWIRYYRPDENSPNSSVSYYIKGQVVAFLLDAKIRRATNGAKSLDDLMRTGYGRYSGARGYTSEEFRRLASDVAGVDLSTWFADAAGSTKELDYAEALDWFGLRFRNIAPSNRAWTGLVAKPQEGRLVVTEVHRGTPAYAAGINVDDEILAIGEYRVRADQWDARLDQYRPGEQVTMLVARRDRLVRLPLTLGAEPERRWTLEWSPLATDVHLRRLAAWLEGK